MTESVMVALIGLIGGLAAAVISAIGAVYAAKNGAAVRKLLIGVSCVALIVAVLCGVLLLNGPDNPDSLQSTDGGITDTAGSTDEGNTTGGADSTDEGSTTGGADSTDGGANKAIVSGSCGDNTMWSLYEDGLLIISGSGAIVTGIGDMPWFSVREQIERVEIQSGVTSIGEYAFYTLEYLISVEMADTVTSIGEQAFADCTDLTSVSMSESVSSIGKYAFYNCESLKAISIPEGVTRIQGWTFARCRALETVEFPDGLRHIEGFAFTDCRSLGYVSVPKDTKVEGSAFYQSSATVVLR